jgi:hypothetical protein
MVVTSPNQQKRHAIHFVPNHLAVAGIVQAGQRTVPQDMGRAQNMVFLVDSLRLFFAQLVGKDVAELTGRDRNHAIVVEWIRQDRENRFTVDSVRTFAPAGPAAEIAISAQPRPRLSRTCVNRPPKE